MLAAVLLSGCASGPRPIRVGEDHCEMCRMRVAEARFATELVTPQGRTLVFDSIECLVRYMAAQPGGSGTAGEAWVTDFDAPDALLAATSAFYAESANLRSPMGIGVAAFSTEDGRDATVARLTGRPMDWTEVRQVIHANWLIGP
jgi:copper chaperone NosL